MGKVPINIIHKQGRRPKHWIIQPEFQSKLRASTIFSFKSTDGLQCTDIGLKVSCLFGNQKRYESHERLKQIPGKQKQLIVRHLGHILCHYFYFCRVILCYVPFVVPIIASSSNYVKLNRLDEEENRIPICLRVCR